jgi:hypothetical protein
MKPDKTNSVLSTGLAVLLLLAGCATTSAPPLAGNSAEPVVAVPLTEGRITLVNQELGFVVLDFGGTTVPAAGTPLQVFRGVHPVGAVRVTEPARGQYTSADIVQGEPQVGDHVR